MLIPVNRGHTEEHELVVRFAHNVALSLCRFVAVSLCRFVAVRPCRLGRRMFQRQRRGPLQGFHNKAGTDVE